MKRLRLLVILSIIFNILLFNTSEGFCIDGKIHKNVYINNINVSNLTKKECEDLVNSYIDENRFIVLKYQDKEVSIDKNEIGVSYNIDKAVNDAYNTGRDGDIISNIKKIISLNRGNKEVILLECVYDISKIDYMIEYFNQGIYKEPVDSTIKISNGQIIVTEDSKGREIDKKKLKDIIIDNIIKCNLEKEEIPIKILAPKYTYDRLKKIDTLLGSYETTFNLKNENRVNNINIAAISTGDIIIDTNEIFSFNDILAKDMNKLKEAPIIINGKTENGIGGGICQVSTTIYNASLYANMHIEEISNHSIPSFYIEKGRDATVSHGFIDFKFKNTNNSPIFIRNQILGNVVRTEIYGNSNDKKDIDIETEVVKIIKNNTVYRLDSNIQKGTSVVEQKGRLGYKINTFRVYKNNGKIINKELINLSYYPPCDEIIVIGSDKNSVTE